MPQLSDTQQELEKQFVQMREAIGELIKRGIELIEEEQQQGDPKQGQVESWIIDVSRRLNECLKKWREQSFQVAVLALVKAGKSTLLNAWLGDEFMPTSNVPETARVVRIRHNPDDGAGTLRESDRVLAQGAKQISAYLREQNAAVREKGVQPILDDLILTAPLLALGEQSMSGQRFEILDTPGPNEAGGQLRNKVYRLLGEVDVIIYLLDYTKLGTNEEQEMLQTLATLRVDLLDAQRLFFVVNKIDAKNWTAPLLEETAAYVADHLPQYKITVDRVLLVSAEYALLARLVESGRASSAALYDFKKRTFGEVGADVVGLEACQSAAPKIFTISRMQELENRVLSVIYSERGNLFLSALLADLNRHLSVFYNALSARHGALITDQAKLEKDIESLEQRIEMIRGKLKPLGSEIEQFQQEIKQFIYDRFGNFQREINGIIDEAFASADSPGQEKSLFAKLFSPVVGLIRRVANMKSANEDEVKKAVVDLSLQIAKYLSDSLEAFTTDIEREMQHRQGPIFEKLQGTVSALSQAVGSAVSDVINVPLRPVDIIIQIPTAEQLHQAIIASAQSVEPRLRTETHGSYEKGLIWKPVYFFDTYLIDVPWYGRKYVSHETTVIEYGVTASALKEFWSKRIVSLLTDAARIVDQTTEEKIRSAFKEAKGQLDQLADNYMRTLRKSIEDAKQKDKREILKQVEEHLTGVTHQLEDVEREQAVLAEWRHGKGHSVT